MGNQRVTFRNGLRICITNVLHTTMVATRINMAKEAEVAMAISLVREIFVMATKDVAAVEVAISAILSMVEAEEEEVTAAVVAVDMATIRRHILTITIKVVVVAAAAPIKISATLGKLEKEQMN